MLHISHYRPDAITRTSVVEPWNIQKRNPVAMAEKVLNRFTQAYTYPGPGLTQKPQVPASRMAPAAVGTQHNGNATAGAQFYGLPSMPSAGQGQAGTYVTRDAYGRAVIRSTGASGLAPADTLRRGVVQTTVMQGPMHNVYGVMREQYRAFKTGSIWAQTRAEQDVARITAGVPLPFTRGL